MLLRVRYEYDNGRCFSTEEGTVVQWLYTSSNDLRAIVLNDKTKKIQEVRHISTITGIGFRTPVPIL